MDKTKKEKMRTILALVVLVTITSCNITKKKGIYDQGKLEYRISYLNAKDANYDPSFLPKKMTLEFNQDFSINRIDGFMGLFKLGNMTYFKNRRVRTHLKVLEKNYAVMGKRNEMMCCFDCLSGMKIEKDTTTAIIGGLKSKRVNVSFKNGQPSYYVYYTTEINLSKPNSTNPYREIDGVLTEFRLIMGPYLMQFSAIKFDPNRSPKQEMDVPKDAITVGREEMVAILNRLMEQKM